MIEVAIIHQRDSFTRPWLINRLPTNPSVVCSIPIKLNHTNMELASNH